MTGTEFRAWRKANGFTIPAMAEAFRVGKRTIVDWEQRESGSIPGIAEVALEAVKKNVMWTRKPLDRADTAR